MIRIRGHIGDWPVDLSVELDADDWAQLTQGLSTAAAQTGPPVTPADAPWQAAQDLLRQQGQVEGPQLLALLESLAGNERVAKRLLVRLRHSENVRVDSDGDAPVYRWVGD